MLSYQHGYHAGNFADVLKHLVLIQVLQYLTRKPGPLRYVDTHAGRGHYALDSAEARKTGEFHNGIGRLWQLEANAELPSALSDYLTLIRSHVGGTELNAYPGSPWIARELLRSQDRLDLCELHPQEFEALDIEFAGSRNIRCHATDGFAVSLGLVPPAERRGLILIDPSYELKQDYERVVRHVAGLHRRFATGVYLIWYPILDGTREAQMASAWRDSGIRRIDRYRLSLAEDTQPGMSGSGMIVINPTWGLADAVESALATITGYLNPTGRPSYQVEQLIAE